MKNLVMFTHDNSAVIEGDGKWAVIQNLAKDNMSDIRYKVFMAYATSTDDFDKVVDAYNDMTEGASVTGIYSFCYEEYVGGKK